MQFLRENVRKILCLLLVLLFAFSSPAVPASSEPASVFNQLNEDDGTGPAELPESYKKIDRVQLYERFLALRAAQIQAPLIFERTILKLLDSQQPKAIVASEGKVTINVSRELFEYLRYLQQEPEIFFLKAQLFNQGQLTFNDTIVTQLIEYMMSINPPPPEQLLAYLDAELDAQRWAFQFGNIPFFEELHLYRGLPHDKKKTLLEAHFSNIPESLEQKIYRDEALTLDELKEVYQKWTGLKSTDDPQPLLDAILQHFEFYRSLPTSADADNRTLVKRFVDAAQSDKHFFDGNPQQAILYAYRYACYLKNQRDRNVDQAAIRKLAGDNFDYLFVRNYLDTQITLEKLAVAESAFFADEESAAHFIPAAISQLLAGEHFEKPASDVIFYTLTGEPKNASETVRFQNNILYYLGNERSSLLPTLINPLSNPPSRTAISEHFPGTPGAFAALTPDDARAITEGRFFDLPLERRLAVLGILFPALTLAEISDLAVLDTLSHDRQHTFALLLMAGKDPSKIDWTATRPSENGPPTAPGKTASDRMIVLLDGSKIYSQAYLNELAAGLHGGEALPTLTERLERKWRYLKDTVVRNVNRYDIPVCPYHGRDFQEMIDTSNIDPGDFADVQIEDGKSLNELPKIRVRRYVRTCPYCEAEKTARGNHNERILKNETHLADPNETLINTGVLFLTPYFKIFSPAKDISDPARERAWHAAKFGLWLGIAHQISRPILKKVIIIDTLLYLLSGQKTSFTGLPPGLIQFSNDTVQLGLHTYAYIQSRDRSELYKAAQIGGSLSTDLVMIGIGRASVGIMTWGVGFSPAVQRLARLQYARDVRLQTEIEQRQRAQGVLDERITRLRADEARLAKDPLRSTKELNQVRDEIRKLESTRSEMTHARVQFFKGRLAHYLLEFLSYAETPVLLLGLPAKFFPSPALYRIKSYRRAIGTGFFEREQERLTLKIEKLESAPDTRLAIDARDLHLLRTERGALLELLREKGRLQAEIQKRHSEAGTIDRKISDALGDTPHETRRSTFLKSYNDYLEREAKTEAAGEGANALVLARESTIREMRKQIVETETLARRQLELIRELGKLARARQLKTARYQELLRERADAGPQTNAPIPTLTNRVVQGLFRLGNRVSRNGVKNRFDEVSQVKSEIDRLENRRQEREFELSLLDHHRELLIRTAERSERMREVLDRLEGVESSKGEVSSLAREITDQLTTIDSLKAEIATTTSPAWGNETAQLTQLRDRLAGLEKTLAEDRKEAVDETLKKEDSKSRYSPVRLLLKLFGYGRQP